MNKNTIILILLFTISVIFMLLVLTPIAYGDAQDTRDLDMLTTSARSFFPGLGSSDYYATGSQIRLFYPVKDWELDVCTRGITSDTTKLVSDDASVKPSTVALHEIAAGRIEARKIKAKE